MKVKNARRCFNVPPWLATASIYQIPRHRLRPDLPLKAPRWGAVAYLEAARSGYSHDQAIKDNCSNDVEGLLLLEMQGRSSDVVGATV